MFTLAFGYWTLGNRQMYFNEINTKQTAFEEVMDYKHPYVIMDYRKGGYHLIPLLIMMLITLFQNFFIRMLTKMFLCCKILKHSEGIDIYSQNLETEKSNENLGNYWECIGGLE